jgi:hypothetical protein
MLSIAFPPDYTDSGLFYVAYTEAIYRLDPRRKEISD